MGIAKDKISEEYVKWSNDSPRFLSDDQEGWCEQGFHAGYFIAFQGQQAEIARLNRDKIKHELDISALIEERDIAHDTIDSLCDAVGIEYEWSSSYGFDDAINYVTAEIARLKAEVESERVRSDALKSNLDFEEKRRLATERSLKDAEAQLAELRARVRPTVEEIVKAPNVSGEGDYEAWVDGEVIYFGSRRAQAIHKAIGGE